jgi:hypothetical protein
MKELSNQQKGSVADGQAHSGPHESWIMEDGGVGEEGMPILLEAVVGECGAGGCSKGDE